jgi:hypothetical protein
MIEALATDLLSQSAIVSNGVYHLEIPKDSTLPALSYAAFSDTPDKVLDGTGGRYFVLQVSSVASSVGAAAALAKRVRQTLTTSRGVFGGLTVTNVIESVEHPNFASGIASRTADFIIHYEE